MDHDKKLKKVKLFLCCGAAAVCLTVPSEVWAAQDSLLSVTEESQILPIPDGSGKYMLKSDGFYCLNPDGRKENTPAVHYFDHFVIDGTVFDGYYYHNGEGEFTAGSPHVEELRQLSVPSSEQEEEVSWAAVFDGYYMVGNLGKLTAAPQIRYMDHLVMNGVTFDGYYFFDETGRLVTDPGIHYISMNSNGRSFEGNYYFGGTNGALTQEPDTTPEGFAVSADGKVQNLEDLNINTLKPQLETMLSGYQGDWSVYVKDLVTGEELTLNDTPMYSASLIKPFILAQTYANMDAVLASQGRLLNMPADNVAVSAKVQDLMWNMITVSDNESANELVRLQTDSHDFLKGAEAVNAFLKSEGYEETSVQHTLHPSSSASQGLGGSNTTTVRECGKLLESIYNGECVSPEASEAMLNMLLNQQNTWKIPDGLQSGIQVANKTGETDVCQHDIAIVYGEKTTYILCVMSQDCPDENTAIENIRDISRVTYSYLNYQA